MRLAAALFSLTLILSGCEGETILTTPKPPTPEPAPRDIPVIPPAFAESLIGRRRADGLKIRIYDTGAVSVRGHDISSIKSTAARPRVPVPAFLIKHPKQGYVLFDTGIGAASGQQSDCLHASVEVKRNQDIMSQLRGDLVDPEKVRFVILSHLHREHAGLAAAFRQATVVVDRREWLGQKVKQVEKPDPNELDPAALEPLLKLRLVDLSTQSPFGAFDHGLDLFSDGSVVLVDLSGHTAGSMGAWVNLDSGAVLLAGDATWLLDNHQDLAIPKETFIADLSSYWRRLYEMRSMQEAVTNLVIYPGHDLDVLGLQARSDVSLAPAPR
ncbi:MAG: N-acyl homoserine lactonase family protein [Elusimicrobia bacterium]|nr:N-acyl homoserine lactonase family protein [Elusimicrobiota bacterium]